MLVALLERLSGPDPDPSSLSFFVRLLLFFSGIGVKLTIRPILQVCRRMLCACLPLLRSTSKACILARCSSLKFSWYRSRGLPAMSARSWNMSLRTGEITSAQSFKTLSANTVANHTLCGFFAVSRLCNMSRICTAPEDSLELFTALVTAAMSSSSGCGTFLDVAILVSSASSAPNSPPPALRCCRCALMDFMSRSLERCLLYATKEFPWFTKSVSTTEQKGDL
mmetsp:Transcript_19211/g.57963  ORF Transcript_19211/g.57963 Transcript_19211/m.57963 type:complete len:224 (+) Transcript_19211:435-1106(+)